MSDYSSLKATINANVKTNGNQEITGSIMNSVLNEMVNSLGAGYQFIGVATPTNPGSAQTPDYKCFYLATTPGTYTNLGGLVVAEGEVALLKYDTSWTKEVTEIATADKLNQLNKDVDSVGQNYIPRCTYDPNGSILGNPNWFIGVDYIPVKKGDTIVWNPGKSNQEGSLVIYNSAKERINYYIANATERTIVLSVENAAFIRPSFSMDNLSSAKIIKNGVEVWNPEIREMGVAPKEKQTNIALGYITGEESLLYSIQDGTPGNFMNPNCVVVRGRNTVVIPGIPGHKYKIILTKTPHEGYNFYFSWGAYTTDSPANFISNRTRTTGWIEDKEFVLNSNEYGFAILIGEITAPSDSANFSPIRESEFSIEDVSILDVTNSRFEEIQNNIDTQIASNSVGTIMTSLSATSNISFGEHSLTINKKGFSYIVSGVKYDIVGEQDFNVDFGTEVTRRYFCLNTKLLSKGKTAFTDVLNIFDNSVPSKEYVILLDFYYGKPQDGLLMPDYLCYRQDRDTIGAQIVVDYETKGKTFSALYKNAQNVLSFLFFTDPHISNIGEGFFNSYMTMMKKIQQFYQSLPIDFVLSGGDWLNNSDTPEIACYKLGNIKQQLKTRLSPCYQMLGNHDTNYQGTSALSQNAINALIFNDFGESFYRVERHNCALYIFDSGTDGRTTLSSYDKEQLDWFAKSLVAEQKDNIVIASHIIIEGSQGSSHLSAFATAIEQIAKAYNNRGSVTIDGVSYVFTGVTGNGRIRCFIGGHTHYDYVNTEEAIPIFITLNAIATNELSWERPDIRFDMILIDFDEGKLHAIRVGNGENRTIDLA